MITCWWTIGKLARLIAEYYEVTKHIAVAVINSTKTADKENKIASGLLALMREPLIHGDILFLAAFAHCFLNSHMKWYGGDDPNVREPGFLIFHRAVHYFIMHDELKRLEEGGWQENNAFQEFVQFLSTLSTVQKDLKISMTQKFFQSALKQTRKHNERYAITKPLFFGCFGEPEISKFVAQLILGEDVLNGPGWLLANNESFMYFSKVHRKMIDIRQCIEFLHHETLQTIHTIMLELNVERFKRVLQHISEGCNIWDRTNEDVQEPCLQILKFFAAQSSNQQNNKQFVKAMAYLKRTGKSEKKANIFAIASNGSLQNCRGD